MVRRLRVREVLMGRLRRGDDLLECLTAFVRREGVRLGRVEALGAVERARVGYYDQGAFEYRYLEFDTDLEILALLGNVSLRDGEPMVHAHVTLGDAQGRAFGGHLAPGTRVFACEFAVEVLDGEELHRGHDEATGLPLWTE
ncbi:MAG: DNA-binding protein [Deferrisomatales bacterium]|nr:DNA-binding protein [Deferrisomatales bacterium]